MHSAPWVRRNLGVGTASAYVIGFDSGDSWWTLFFDRIREASATGVVEVWKIDGYNSRGQSWERRFWYWPDGRWQQVSPRDAAQSKDASQRADR
jgi:elongation factor P hydroxylase